MAFDIGKSFNVAMIPIVILVAIGIFSSVVGAIPILNILMCIVGLPLFVVGLIVNAWAGFKAVKEAQMDVMGGALTGGIAALVAGIINGIVSYVLNLLGIGVNVAAGNNDLGGAALGAGVGLVAMVGGIIVGTILGLILGAIGAFIAGMNKM